MPLRQFLSGKRLDGKLFEDTDTGRIYRVGSKSADTVYYRCRNECGGTGSVKGGDIWRPRQPHATWCVVDDYLTKVERMKANMRAEAQKLGKVEEAFRNVEESDE